MSVVNFVKKLTVSGKFMTSAIMAGVAAVSGVAVAQQKVPLAAALQSCSVNGSECQLDSYAGWFVGAAESAKIEQFSAAAVKPSVTTEERTSSDGRTKVVVFKGANGKYLAVQPNKNWEANFVATSADDRSAQFVAVPALESPPGQVFTSFMPILDEEHKRFLRHEGFKLFAHKNAETLLFRRDASWRILNAETINTENARKTKQPLPPAPKDGLFYPTSHGDVHIRSVDGLRFDYQGAGDHILIQSLDGDVVIQSRQEMWDQNPKVSVNRAGAMKVMGDKVVWYALPAPALQVNGKSVELTDKPMPLPNGGTLEMSGSASKRILMVRWPGNRPVGRMQMYSNGTMDVQIRNDSLKGRQYEGLIGNYDNNSSNDLQIRGGATFASPTNEVIAQVGPSWLIKPDESLFDRKPKTPPAVAIRNQPTLELLPAAAREEAAATCDAAGITDPLSRRHCVYDVAATGDKTFVESAKNYQAFVAALPPAQRALETVDQKDAAAMPSPRSIAATVPAATFLPTDEIIQRGARQTMNGHYFIFQDDGNFCVYRTQGDQFVWCINNDPNVRYNDAAKVQMTRDGRLLVSDASGKTIWQAPAINPQPGSRAVITSNGILQVQTPSGVIVWSSRK